mgnify:CR=1 FL=1
MYKRQVLKRGLFGIYVFEDDGYYQNEKEVPVYYNNAGYPIYLNRIQGEISGMVGEKKIRDVNGDGVVSMQEAFQYARTADTQTETPQYNSIGASLGNSLSLWGGISTTVYVRNRIIQANEIINGTNIEVENVTISNNANVVFDAAGITKFKGGFKCEKGSSMKVK